jgi:hypothetical protein
VNKWQTSILCENFFNLDIVLHTGREGLWHLIFFKSQKNFRDLEFFSKIVSLKCILHVHLSHRIGAHEIYVHLSHRIRAHNGHVHVSHRIGVHDGGD